MRIGGFKWGQNTCGCGHGAHCHIPGDNICMYSESEGGHPASAFERDVLVDRSQAIPTTCQCGGYTPQAAWILDLCRVLKIDV